MRLHSLGFHSPCSSTFGARVRPCTRHTFRGFTLWVIKNSGQYVCFVVRTVKCRSWVQHMNYTLRRAWKTFRESVIKQLVQGEYCSRDRRHALYILMFDVTANYTLYMVCGWDACVVHFCCSFLGSANCALYARACTIALHLSLTVKVGREQMVAHLPPPRAAAPAGTSATCAAHIFSMCHST